MGDVGGEVGEPGLLGAIGSPLKTSLRPRSPPPVSASSAPTRQWVGSQGPFGRCLGGEGEAAHASAWQLSLRRETTLANTPVNGLLGRQVLVTPMAGGSSCDTPRTLNPAFVEALMGWPTGWTGFGSVATEWSRWSRRMRCELSRLNCWPMDEAAT